MNTCPICEKHKKPVEIIYEDQDWIITPGPLGSQLLGYLYIEPKRHVENWSDFTNQELIKIGPLIKNIEEKIKKVLDVDRVYVVTISEAVRHLHFHIIPREYENNVKGLPLIEQATQQKPKGNSQISESNYTKFIKKLKDSFLV